MTNEKTARPARGAGACDVCLERDWDTPCTMRLEAEASDVVVAAADELEPTRWEALRAAAQAVVDGTHNLDPGGHVRVRAALIDALAAALNGDEKDIRQPEPACVGCGVRAEPCEARGQPGKCRECDLSRRIETDGHCGSLVCARLSSLRAALDATFADIAALAEAAKSTIEARLATQQVLDRELEIRTLRAKVLELQAALESRRVGSDK